MVVFDGFIQCHFVLDVVLLSVVILPLYRELMRRERKVFLYLRDESFQYERNNQNGQDLLLKPLVGAESRRSEGQFLATGIVVAFDNQRFIWPILHDVGSGFITHLCAVERWRSRLAGSAAARRTAAYSGCA